MGREQGGGVAPSRSCLGLWTEKLERSDYQFAGAIQIEHPQIEVGEVDAVAPDASWSEADALASESSADRPTPARQRDRPRALDAFHQVVTGIARFLRDHRSGAGSWSVNAGGRSSPKAVVRTVPIVTSPPSLQATRLLCCSMRNDQLRFHDSVHLLVRIIVDGTPTDEFHADTQLPPPQAELGESMRPVTKKGCSQIAADHAGATITTE